MNKKQKFWTWALAWLILAILSCTIRLYPLRAHLWDNAQEQVTLNLANQPGAVPQKIYLLGSDSYDFYNLTENIVNKGQIADVIKASKYFNPLMCAPFGFWQPFTLHPYWGFVIYKFLQLFDHHIPLMSAVAYTPLFTYLFILMAFLWVCRVLNYSVIASFVGGLFLIMAPINLKRGSLGWFRTDPYNILFPLLLLGCLFLALRPASKKEGYLWAVIFGLALGFYALFWQEWGLLFFIGVACALGTAAYNYFIKKDRPHARQNLLFLPLFIGTSLLVISMCFSFQDFFILFKEGLEALAKFTHRGLGLWPNQYMTVGELEKTTLGSFTTSAGGPVFMLLALGGWIYSLRISFENFRQSRAIDTLILTIFLLVTFTLSFVGQRFVLFATIPLSVLAAAACHRFIGLRSAGLPLAGLLIALVLFNADRDIRTVLTPIFNSTWDEALTKIRTDTPPDSIVNTWWSSGHFIKAIAHRRVPFDGASLDQGQVGYWMANMFLSQDEYQARGILRMLNSSGNRPAEFLVKCGLKLSDATSLLLAIASQDKPEAAQRLKGIISDDQIQTLLTMTHDQHPHSYVLVYTELINDNLMLAFNGHWNIKKIEEINSNPEMLKKVPRYNSRDFVDFLWGIMGGPPKYSDALPLLGQSNNPLVFGDNLTIDLNTMDAQIHSPQYGQGHPLSVFYLKDNSVVEHINPEGKLNYSVVLYQEDGQYVARLMDRALANSLIMKLYYFDGRGLKYFKPLILSHDLTGRRRIKAFEVRYE